MGGGVKPLADLHRHLDGSLRRSTLLELADQVGVEVPADLGFVEGMGLEAKFKSHGFRHMAHMTDDSDKCMCLCKSKMVKRICSFDEFTSKCQESAPGVARLDGDVDGRGP